MAVDPQVRALARKLNKIERQVLARKQPGLSFSSIEDGALSAVDVDGNLTMVIGKQYDETSTSAVVAGPNPPIPSAAGVTGAMNGLLIYWNGTFSNALVAPMDWARVTVHAYLTSTFTAFDPLDETHIVGAFNQANGGGLLVGLPYGEHLIFLTSWSQAGKFSQPSVPVAGSPTLVATGDLEQSIINDIATAKSDAAAAQVAAGTASSVANAAQLDADQAAADALAALGVAQSKGKLIVQVSAPTGGNAVPENLWIDISGTPPKNQPKRYNTTTSAWEVITDVVAVNAAAQALTAFNNAQTAQDRADLAYATAVSASTAAGNAQTSADGKNTIWYQDGPPAGTGHKVNDTWHETDNGYTPYQWSAAGTWDMKQWGHQSIATLDVGKATVGFLAGARIDARAINVSHLAVGDFTNLWPDPYFILRVAGQPPLPVTRMTNATHATTPAPPVGGNVAILNNRDHIALDSITAKPGDEFLIEVTYKKTVGAAGFLAGIWQRKADGTDTTVVAAYVPGQQYLLTPDVDLGNGWFRQAVVVQVNPLATDAAQAALWLQINQTGVGGTVVAVSDISWRRRNKGSLIVDGGVSAKQVNAEIIIADDIYAKTGYIGKLKADQIETGLLDATIGILQALEVGPRIRIDPLDGIVITLDEGEIRLPANGGPANITAGINATWLTIENNLSIRGSGAIQGELSMANGITKPLIAPTISTKYPSTPIAAFGDGADIYRGLVEESSTVYMMGFNFAGIGFRKINKDATYSWAGDAWDSAVARNWRSDVGQLHGFCKVGSATFILWQDGSRVTTGTYEGKFYLTKLNSSYNQVAEVFVGENSAFGGFSPALVNIEGNVGMLWQSFNANLNLRRYADSGTVITTLNDQVIYTSYGIRYGVKDAHFGPVGVGGASRLWVAVESNNFMPCFTAPVAPVTGVSRASNVVSWPAVTNASGYDVSVSETGSSVVDQRFVTGTSITVASYEIVDSVKARFASTFVAAEQFVKASASINGIAFDTRAQSGNVGDRFQSYSGTNLMYDHGRNKVAEAVRVSYAWYDGTSPTTHKTEAGPEAASYYRQTRSTISIEAPVAPDMLNEDPNNLDKANQIIIYAAAGEAPREQAILAIGIRKLDMPNTPLLTGPLPSASNEFATAGVTPGILQSTATDSVGRVIKMSGDGSGKLGEYTWDTTGRVTSPPGFPGEVKMIAGATIPTGWANCNGFAVSRTSAEYARLFSVLGTTYGAGDGSTTFNLPNFVDKFPRGNSRGAGGGSDTSALPNHVHPGANHSHPVGAVTLSKVSRGSGTATPQVLSDISGTTGVGGGAVGDNPTTNPAIATVPSYTGLLFIIKL